MIATFTPEGHLISWQGKKKICKQLMSCHPCYSVKGVYELTEAFVGALLCSLALSCSCHHFLSHCPAPPLPPFHAPSRSSIFSLYLPASRSSSSVAGATLSGFSSERRSLSAWFMFRISHLMRTKEINWWFKPNETSVKLTGLINRNK